MSKARVLVVEDHAFVRESIVSLVNSQPDMMCCGQADSIAATLRLIASRAPNLLLLDLRLSDGDALGLIDSLRKHFPALPVLILSQYEERLYAKKVLQAGARGYLMKHDAPLELPEAIRTVLSGEVYLSPTMTQHLLNLQRSSFRHALNGQSIPGR